MDIAWIQNIKRYITMKALLLSLLFFLSVGKLLGQQPYYKYGETTHGKKTSYHVSQDSLFVIMEKIEGHHYEASSITKYKQQT